MKFSELVTDKAGRIQRPYVAECIAFLLMTAEFVKLSIEDDLSEWFVTIYVGAFVTRSAWTAWVNKQEKKDEIVARMPRRRRVDDPDA